MPTLDPRALLAQPRVYDLTQRAFGAVRARTRFVERYVRPQAGERLLDIGCGTGDILDHLPPVDYVGFDLSAEYVDAARERYGDRGTFHCADVLDAEIDGEPFDVVIATGVIHHLDDERADRLLALAASILKDDGRFLSWDGAFVDGQARIARMLLERDRGEHVRTPETYVALAERRFGDVRHHIVTDFLHVPYTHCVLELRAPERAAAAG
jgi:SAM-dependent methyltransferase